VKVVAGKGNNLHQVVDSTGNSYLVSMPTKFRYRYYLAYSVAGKGNNLHQVVDSAGNSYLVSMPTKFRYRYYLAYHVRW
jgi:hypothetical protein